MTNNNMESICPLCGCDSGIAVPLKWWQKVWQKVTRKPKVYHCWRDACGAVYEIDPNAPKIVDPNEVR